MRSDHFGDMIMQALAARRPRKTNWLVRAYRRLSGRKAAGCCGKEHVVTISPPPKALWLAASCTWCGGTHAMYVTPGRLLVHEGQPHTWELDSRNPGRWYTAQCTSCEETRTWPLEMGRQVPEVRSPNGSLVG